MTVDNTLPVADICSVLVNVDPAALATSVPLADSALSRILRQVAGGEPTGEVAAFANCI